MYYKTLKNWVLGFGFFTWHLPEIQTSIQSSVPWRDEFFGHRVRGEKGEKGEKGEIFLGIDMVRDYPQW